MTQHASHAGRFLTVVLCVLAISCAPSATVQSGDEIAADLDLPPYDGPRASLAVGPCEDRSGGAGTYRVRTPQGQTEVSIGSEIGGGIADMMVTALVNTDRFRVLETGVGTTAAMERERNIEGNQDAPDQASAPRSADLMVTCAVTQFEPQASGAGGAVADVVGGVIGGILGATETSTAALDIRLVDVDTREVLSAFTVNGEARDVSAGGALLDFFGGAGGGLGAFSNTPIEEAIRIALLEAVKEIVDTTPGEYFR